MDRVVGRDKDPSTPVTRNDCAAKTVAPKRGRQKLPEGKVEIPPPLQIGRSPLLEGWKGCVDT